MAACLQIHMKMHLCINVSNFTERYDDVNINVRQVARFRETTYKFLQSVRMRQSYIYVPLFKATVTVTNCSHTVDMRTVRFDEVLNDSYWKIRFE